MKELRCFVIMPFSTENSLSIYENWIKKAVEECVIGDLTFKCHRADKSLRPGDVISHLIEHLYKSEVVIADLTHQNPNVFYELGVRHTLNNNTILIAQDIRYVPFDLRTQRVIPYSCTDDGMPLLKENIEKSLIEIFTNKAIIDNPIKRYLFEIGVNNIINDTASNLHIQAETLSAEVNELKSGLFEQFAQIKRILQSVPAELPDQTYITNNHIEFGKRLEGVWYNAESASFHYVHIVSGKIKFCYCYGGNHKLTAHYFKFRFLPNILIADFEWFDSELQIAGLSFFEFVGPNTLSGGWWYNTDIDKKELKKTPHLDSLPKNKMNIIKLDRISLPDYDNYPDWAKEYFEKND
jgi:hypothetical protein